MPPAQAKHSSIHNVIFPRMYYQMCGRRILYKLDLVYGQAERIERWMLLLVNHGSAYTRLRPWWTTGSNPSKYWDGETYGRDHTNNPRSSFHARCDMKLKIHLCMMDSRVDLKHRTLRSTVGVAQLQRYIWLREYILTESLSS